MFKVLVFENSLSGHRGYYARLLVLGMRELRVQVILAIPGQAMKSDEGRIQLGNWTDQVEFAPLPDQATDIQARSRCLVDVVRQVSPDRTYIPYSDGIIQLMGFRGKGRSLQHTAIEGLMMRGAFAYPITGVKRRMAQSLSQRLIRRAPWEKLHHLDPIVAAEINRAGGVRGRRVEVMPEAIEVPHRIDREAARHRLGLGTDRFVIVCPGQVNERKGVDLLIQAFAKMGHPDAQLVLLGRTSALVKNMLESEHAPLCRTGRIVWQDRYIETLEFDDLFAAANLVCVPYPRHIGSASILIHAAKRNLAILASDWGWIGWATRTFELGQTVDVMDPQAFAAVLKRMADAGGNVVKSEPAVEAKRRRFLEFHSERNHIAHWTSGIREALGISGDPARIDWSSIVANPDQIALGT